MTRITAQHLTQEKREALLAWLQGEDLDAADIVDDGRFSVHNGWVSGNRYIRSEDGKFIYNARRVDVLKVPFKQKQKNPLPEVLEE
jgi:acyl-coenzyme A synthetase/AMP-(fatty) acid ligase